MKALLQAARLVDDALAKEGLERIDDAGAAFDPTIHDAVEHAPARSPAAPSPLADGRGHRGRDDARRCPRDRWWPTSCAPATAGRVASSARPWSACAGDASDNTSGKTDDGTAKEVNGGRTT